MAAQAPVRGTQSLVHTLAYCWSRPSLLALEVAWRWLFGIPALLLLFHEGSGIYAGTESQLRSTGIFQFTLLDPMRTAVMVSDAFAILWPPVRHALLWIAPLLAVAGSIVAGIGRNTVLRRYDPSLPKKWGTLIVLQLVRIVALAGSFVAWFYFIRWAAGYSLAGEEPNMVLYCALVICLSLGIFTLWALISWVFSVAPLLSLLEDRSFASSLARSLRLGPLTSKLVEVNMVMSIVKIALIVLAMVFSATPLPFESVMQGMPLYLWWTGVTVLYLAASDFFQIARVVSFIQFSRVQALRG